MIPTAFDMMMIFYKLKNIKERFHIMISSLDDEHSWASPSEKIKFWLLKIEIVSMDRGGCSAHGAPYPRLRLVEIT